MGRREEKIPFFLWASNSCDKASHNLFLALDENHLAEAFLFFGIF